MRARRFVCPVLAALLAGGCLSRTAEGPPDAGRELDCDGASAQCTSDTADDDGSAPTPDAPARRVGRFDMGDPANPTAEWSASSMGTGFTGSSVSVALGGTGTYFEVVVDGVVEPVIVTDGSGSYAIATGLAAGSHDVLVFRRDEAEDGPTAFLGFDFGAGGQALAPSPSPARRIEVIGDSISAGYGDECTNASTHYTPQTEDAYIAYGPLAARALGADVHVVAWSGKGMYRNLDGTTTDTMPVLWQRTIPTEPASAWDPSQWVPDAVVINLGTNDYFAPGADPSADYEATYEQFVATLRGAYPGAYIFCTVGPMLTDPQLGEQIAAVQDVVAAEQTAGDPRIALVEFPTIDCGQTGSGCGCDYHPNAVTHQAMATLLEGAIQSALGW